MLRSQFRDSYRMLATERRRTHGESLSKDSVCFETFTFCMDVEWHRRRGLTSNVHTEATRCAGARMSSRCLAVARCTVCLHYTGSAKRYPLVKYSKKKSIAELSQSDVWVWLGLADISTNPYQDMLCYFN